MNNRDLPTLPAHKMRKFLRKWQVVEQFDQHFSHLARYNKSKAWDDFLQQLVDKGMVSKFSQSQWKNPYRRKNEINDNPS